MKPHSERRSREGRTHHGGIWRSTTNGQLIAADDLTTYEALERQASANVGVQATTANAEQNLKRTRELNKSAIASPSDWIKHRRSRTSVCRGQGRGGIRSHCAPESGAIAAFAVPSRPQSRNGLPIRATS